MYLQRSAIADTGHSRRGAPNGTSATREKRVRTPIDAFVLAQLEQRGLSLSPDAPAVTLIRRVTYDLTGLPPTPDQIDRFLANRSPVAYEQYVDELLASPRYGERWARHWLDAAGYADSEGVLAADVIRETHGATGITLLIH